MNNQVISILKFNFNRIIRLKFFWWLVGITTFILSLITLTLYGLGDKYYSEMLIFVYVIIAFFAIIIFNFWNINNFFNNDMSNGIYNLEIRSGMSNTKLFFSKVLFNQIIVSAFIFWVFILHLVIVASFNKMGGTKYMSTYLWGIFTLFPMNWLLVSCLLLGYSISTKSFALLVPSLVASLQVLGLPIGLVAPNVINVSMSTPKSVLTYSVKELKELSEKYPNGFTKTMLDSQSDFERYFDVTYGENTINNQYSQLDFIRDTGMTFGYEEFLNQYMINGHKDFEIKTNQAFSSSKYYIFLKILNNEFAERLSSFQDSFFSQNNKKGFYGLNQFDDVMKYMESNNFYDQVIKNNFIKNNVKKDEFKKELNSFAAIMSNLYKNYYYYLDNNVHQYKSFNLDWSKIEYTSYGDNMLNKMIFDLREYVNSLAGDDDAAIALAVTNQLFYTYIPFTNYDGMIFYSGSKDPWKILSLQSFRMISPVRMSESVIINRTEEGFKKIRSISVEDEGSNSVSYGYLLNLFESLLIFGTAALIFIFKKRGGK